MPSVPPGWPRRRLAAGLAALAVCACATNPATGRRQISLIGEEQEIQMGREADREISAAVGLYDENGLAAYVARVGQSLAAASERPRLPWTFRVLDDPSVNAIALPGGYIYATRGLLTHLNSEAELATVLGHEVGHVTARHTVSRMSKAQVANLGLMLGMILRPQLRNYGNLAEVGLGLLFLKYSRDDETQADELGLRYLTGAGYDPRPSTEVFTTLERVGTAEGRGRVPGWLATHPSPEDRRGRMGRQIQAAQATPGGTVEREAYLRRINGMVFGEDPREGFFQQSAFYHPELRFRLEFPPGWQTSNQKQAVAALSPGRDAVVVLTLAGRDSPELASREFFSQQAVRQGQSWRGDINGLPAVAHSFQALTQEGQLQGLVAFLEHAGKVYQLLGYAPVSRWGRHESAVARSLNSFARLTDRRYLDVEPRRLQVVSLPRGMSLSEFNSRYPSTVNLQTVAIINGVREGEALPPGSAKRVVGGEGL